MSRILRWLAWLGFLAALIWAVVYLSGSPEAGLVTGLAMVIAMLAIGVVAAWWDDPWVFRSQTAVVLLGVVAGGLVSWAVQVALERRRDMHEIARSVSSRRNSAQSSSTSPGLPRLA